MHQKRSQTLTCLLAGDAICKSVSSSNWFNNSHTVGVYVTAEKLREVDTLPIIQEALQQGVLLAPRWLTKKNTSFNCCACCRQKTVSPGCGRQERIDAVAAHRCGFFASDTGRRHELTWLLLITQTLLHPFRQRLPSTYCSPTHRTTMAARAKTVRAVAAADTVTPYDWLKALGAHSR
jgi:hypothetical protein